VLDAGCHGSSDQIRIDLPEFSEPSRRTLSKQQIERTSAKALARASVFLLRLCYLMSLKGKKGLVAAVEKEEVI
jgi:hypothetical protein